MICKRCADAADRRAEPSEHCNEDGTWCDCAHKPTGTLIAKSEPETVEEFDREFAEGDPVSVVFSVELQESLEQMRRGEGKRVVFAEDGTYTLEELREYYDNHDTSGDMADAVWEDEDPEGVFAKLDTAIAEGTAGLTAPPEVWLSSVDPEPPRGSRVLCLGSVWKRTDDDDWPGKANWEQEDAEEFEPETWTKIAGNYGPVRLLEES